MNADTVDARTELCKAVDARLAFSPVVVMNPVIDERLRGSERHTLRPVVHSLALGPSDAIQPCTQIVDSCFGDVNLEWRKTFCSRRQHQRRAATDDESLRVGRVARRGHGRLLVTAAREAITGKAKMIVFL